MRASPRSLGAVLAAVLLAAWQEPLAAPCEIGQPRTAAEAIEALDDLELGGCLGDSACTLGVCRDVQAALGGEEALSQGDAVHLLLRVRDEAARLDRDLPGVTTLLEMLSAWQDSLRLRPATGLSTAVWNRHGFTLFRGGPELNWENILEESCRDPGRCATVARAAAQVLTLAQLERRVLEKLLQQSRRQTVEQLRLLDRRWAAYLAHGPAAYPWELWLVARGARARDASTFPEPPSRQWLLLHPGSGFQHVAAGSDRLQEAVFLEVVGYRSWIWEGDELRPRLGASAVVAWDGDDRGHAATGLLLHLFPNLSVGAAYRSAGEKGARWPVYVTADLGKLITRRGELKRAIEERWWGGLAGR